MTELVFELALFVAQLALAGALMWLVVKLTAIAISNGLNSPFLATPHSYFPKIADALAIRPGDVVYDLGSGDGRFMFFCAQRRPDARFVGIERNPLLIAYARLYAYLHGNPHNLSFKQESFFDADFSDATRMYVYLLPVTLNKLTPSLAARGGRRVVSRAYRFSVQKSLETVQLTETPGTHGEHELHIYEW
jgi:SAM-dependent methyltransferase